MSWLKHHPLSSSDTALDVERDGSDKSDASDTSSHTGEESICSDDRASNRGHGTDDTLAVTRVLEEHGIPCCLVGVAALVFYGAGRVRDDWEICIPTELVDKAAELLQSEPYTTQYRLVKPWPYLQPVLSDPHLPPVQK